MAATETVYLRLDPSLKDRLLRAARKEKRSLNAELVLRLERSLASGAGGSVSAGLAGSSALVASDVAEQTVTPEAGGSRLDRSGATLAGTPDALTFVPPSLKQSVTTAGDLAKKQVAPLPKGGKR